MIVVDTSALVAMLVGEPEAGSFGCLLHQTADTYLSAANYVELTIVMFCRTAGRDVELTRDAVRQAGIEVVAVTAHHADLAAEAYRTYGKGRHPAGLNFGDCFA